MVRTPSPTATLTSTARTPVRALVERLKARPDSEHEQALIRICIVALLLAYMAATGGFDAAASAERHAGALLAAGYLVVALGFFVWLVLAPAVTPTRRLTAMVTDFATTSAFLHFGGAAAAPFYPIYLWVTLGNGFRYGLPYLAASVSAAVSGFFMVVVTTPLWLDNMGLGLGLLAALVVIPGYTASLIRKLTEAKAQAEAANRAKSRFLASMSHELRTPLNAVIGVSESLRLSRLDDDQKEMVQTIRTAGSALLALIEDILDLSRIEANKVSVVAEPFDLHRELAELVSMFRPQAAAKGIAYDVHVDAGCPWRLIGDRRHLRQILTNLIANAIKFTDAGRVFVTVAARPAAGGGSVLSFRVEDTGIGIDPEQQERIFERFTQADETVQRRYGGTGLGLAITRSLVDLLGGSLSLTSVPGRGSTFAVELAFAADTAAPAAAGALPQRVVVLGGDAAGAAALGAALAEATTIGTTPRVVHASGSAEAIHLLADGRPARAATALIVDGGDTEAVAAAAAGHGALGGVPRILLAAPGAAAPAFGYVSTLARPVAATALRAALLAAAARGAALAGGDEAAAGLGEDAADGDGGTAAGRALSVLVAEDNPINQKVTRRILEHAGHVVSVVGSGDEALDALDGGRFDALIVDVNMPGMSGIELIKLQRMAGLGLPRLPIIALSADATPETRRACEEAGGDAYLTKPVEPRRLLATLRDLARAGEERAAAEPGRVTSISTHPRYRAEASPSINLQVVHGLGRFGDEAFVLETLTEYAANAEALIAEIRAAVAAGSVAAFREAVHALRGTSGNVGAEGLWRLSQDASGMTLERLRREGEAFAGRLSRELERFRGELGRFAAAGRHGRS